MGEMFYNTIFVPNFSPDNARKTECFSLPSIIATVLTPKFILQYIYEYKTQKYLKMSPRIVDCAAVSNLGIIPPACK